MSSQESEEQAQDVGTFHDKHRYQKLPDWLTTEAKAKETSSTTSSYNLGSHTVEINEQGTLVLHESSTRMTLSADEAYKLLVVLHDNHRDTLRRLAHQPDEPQP